MSLYFFLTSLIQAITEFLPVSSTTHMILVGKFFAENHTNLIWEIALHFGTLLAVIVHFRHDVWLMIDSVLKAPFHQEIRTTLHFKQAILIICATIPTVLVGLILHKMKIFTVLSLPKIALITALFGVLLYVADRFSRNDQFLTAPKAFLLGIAQSLAFITGVSRSGICITSLRFMGIDKKEAVKFSFLLSIPVVMGAVTVTGADLLKENVISINWLTMLQGISISFLLGLCTIRFLLWYISHFSFLLFMVYRFLLAAGLLACAKLF